MNLASCIIAHIRAHASNRAGAILLIALLTGPSQGCWYSGGEALYMLGFGKPAKVEAQFRLTERAILILIDDESGQVSWPPAIRYLEDELGQELIRKEAAKKIIPPETLDHLRQTLPDFNERGAREIGQASKAQQVIWIQIQQFLAEETFNDISEAAYVYATVKVLNAVEEESHSRVRLWPTSPAGTLVSASLNGNEVATLKSKDNISKVLAVKMAEHTAKLFYDHRLSDTGREE